MKPIASLLIFCSCYSFGQEFTTGQSGLIYSDHTIVQLKHIVDSLNLKFRQCELSRTYYSNMQGRAKYVSLDDNVQAALTDIKSGISFTEFLKKYPKASTK